MLKSSVILKYLPFGILLIAVSSNLTVSLLGYTVIWWTNQFFLLLIFWSIKTNYTNKTHSNNLFILNIYLIYIVISFFRGIFLADGYWDWKALISNMIGLLVPIVAFASDSKFLIKYIIKSYIYYTAPLFLIVQFFLAKDEFGFYLAPFSYLLLFIPILPKKWKVICLSVTIYVILADFGARSNLIKFILPILLNLFYFFRKILTIKILNFIRLIIIALPFVFFSLGVFGVLNIFNPNGDKHKAIIDKKRDFKGDIIEDDLTADTRTFLYLEVLSTAKKYNSWIFGRSPARGNISETFGSEDMNKRNERNLNEASILNYFTWLGLVGVILIFILFYQATYLAVNQSNNNFSKITGLFIAFRWSWGWVEDVNIFDIQYFFLWLFIGFCYSKSFREMNDDEMKNWVLGIFERKKSLRQRTKESVNQLQV
jgi:hypothetical protein